MAEVGLLFEALHCANDHKAVPQAQLGVMQLDLSDMASVRALADTFRTRFSHLNVSINNAGILAYSQKANADGIELQCATTHLGHFLLSALLFEMIPDDTQDNALASRLWQV